MDEGRRHPDLAPLRGSGEALGVLPTATWRVLHDVPWPGCAEATIDHVAVGPTGVYVIDAHGDSGCDAGRPAQAASAVAPAVAGITCQQPVAVLCLARRKGVAGWAGDVLVCSTANVDRMLRARSTILTPVQVDEAVQVLTGGRAGEQTRRTPPASAAPTSMRTTSSRSGHGERRRWLRGSLSGAAGTMLSGVTGHRAF